MGPQGILVIVFYCGLGHSFKYRPGGEHWWHHPAPDGEREWERERERGGGERERGGGESERVRMGERENEREDGSIGMIRNRVRSRSEIEGSFGVLMLNKCNRRMVNFTELAIMSNTTLRCISTQKHLHFIVQQSCLQRGATITCLQWLIIQIPPILTQKRQQMSISLHHAPFREPYTMPSCGHRCSKVWCVMFTHT